MQIFIFITCVCCGVVSGIVYDVLYIARCAVCGVEKRAYTVKDKIFVIASDIIYTLVFAAMFIFTSVMFDFYELRLFMLLGCVLGAILYLKSFHVFVAFLAGKVYNKVTLKKLSRSKTKNERIKA
ncbi:MAG: spore cortex biosynthesis protein YabQ [Clostridia bacterium]|nr:spore cortex biosynthesis protein YabQ [Clostridia bacterium]